MDIKILDFQNSGSLSVLQFETAGKDSLYYVTFSKALLSKEIEVSEVSDSGSVNNLFIINRSKNFVFFMDGDILSGAKQNREQASDTLNVLLENMKQMKHDLHKSVGAGTEKRFGDKRFTGFELDYEDKLIHMTALPVNKELSALAF